MCVLELGVNFWRDPKEPISVRQPAPGNTLRSQLSCQLAAGDVHVGHPIHLDIVQEGRDCKLARGRAVLNPRPLTFARSHAVWLPMKIHKFCERET